MDNMPVQLITLAIFLMHACGLARSDGLTSRDVLHRIGELELRDLNLQAEFRVLRKQNEALEEEVKLLKIRDVEQTNRITWLEEREKDMLLQTNKNEAMIIELKRLRDSEIDNTDRIRVMEERQLTMEKVIEELLKRTEDITGANVKQQGEYGDNNSSPNIVDDYQSDSKVEANTQIKHEATLPANSHSRIRQADPEIAIAFFASMSNETYHMGHFQPIAFDHVNINLGLAYHPTSGYFYAPVSGVYVFSATMFTIRQFAHFEFAMNGKFISRMFNTDDNFSTTSQTVILSLSKGDEVMIRNIGTDVTLHAAHYCTFSGFLLTTNSGSVNPQIIG